ncbi:hypothetical protein Acr_00g0006180 [Actinidia rufa]|uniref:Uncharacterized protein n=1 Tax=Actinidia rufa TaxID=165716 RepID=A0A7J0D7Z2_9ERIC|nr:hypothetical protein Acr_00g0006180 [Actinidia rufa]
MRTVRTAVGAVSGKWLFDGQKVLCRASHLLSPVIPWDYRRPLPFVQAFSVVIIPSLLSSGALEVTMALARKAFVCSGDCSELRHRGSPSSLHGDGWSIPLSWKGQCRLMSAPSSSAGDHRARSVEAARRGFLP